MKNDTEELISKLRRHVVESSQGTVKMSRRAAIKFLKDRGRIQGKAAKAPEPTGPVITGKLLPIETRLSKVLRGMSNVN